MMNFSLIFCTLNLESFLYESLCHISPLMFLSQRNELFSWTHILKKTLRRTKMLLFPDWNKILKIWDTLFELIQIEVQCIKNYFKFFYHKKLELLEKEPQKPRLKLKKYLSNIYREYLLCSQSNASGSFCRRVLIL